jgi:hypothetical protein
MHFWIGLYAEVDMEMLINGVNAILRVVAEILIPKGSVEDRKKWLKHRDGHDDEDQNL